ncbi:DUF2269 family protein [Cohnella sp. GCM10027633]|uniref:DUF2269 family protein n=1 Tax=unclassified Cohnella TaxID=2636738 RepID=UPI0036337EA4
MNGMQALVVIHVLSALIGIGPTFVSHVLLRRNQSVQEYRASLALAKKLEAFPKTGGPIAVLSGIGLIVAGDYGAFTQTWLIGSLILFVAIQVLTAVAVFPAMKKAGGWLSDPSNDSATVLPPEQRRNIEQASAWLYAASTLGVLLFILMIVKPA